MGDVMGLVIITEDSLCSLVDPRERHSILKDSIFETKRNRTFWTQLHQIRPDGVINPLLIKHIDVILLVGRSINLLKHLCPSHPILNVPSPPCLDVLNFSRREINRWEELLDSWRSKIVEIQVWNFIYQYQFLIGTPCINIYWINKEFIMKQYKKGVG